MTPPECSPERDTVVEALLAHVPFDGWTETALKRALADAGHDSRDAPLLFSSGAVEMIEAWCDLADRRMEEKALAEEGFADLRLAARVRRLIVIRLEQQRWHREAIRRALAVLALPPHAAVATRIMVRTADSIWHAAGDCATDFSWYTKRASLAAIYGATLLFWLRDISDDTEPTLAFLDRRLGGIAELGRTRQWIKKALAHLPLPGLFYSG